MSLWSELVQTLMPWTRRRSSKRSKGGAAPDLKELKQPLSIAVDRQGQSKPLKFDVTEMAVNAFVFETRSAVIEGEMLSMELDLPNMGKTKLTGTVEWVLAGGNSYTGQLNIWTSPEQRAALTQFIRQRRRY